MSKKLHTAEQIIPKLREAKVLLARGAPVIDHYLRRNPFSKQPGSGW